MRKRILRVFSERKIQMAAPQVVVGAAAQADRASKLKMPDVKDAANE